MRNAIIILCTILCSCQTKVPNYIQGYIYNTKGSPLQKIRVEDPYDRNIYTYTNQLGYFRINKLILGEYLYIIKDDKKIDSIYYIRTHPERGEKYYFVEGRTDTLFIDIEKLGLE